MNCHPVLRLLLLVPVLLVSPAQADSPVWKLEKNGKHAFLAGSVHFLGADDYPLPDAFERAWAQSQTLVLETDIERLQSPEFVPVMLAQLTYPAGTGLRDHLQPQTWLALERYLQARGVPAAQLASFRPGMLVTTLLAIELRKLGVTAAGVDQHLDTRARAEGRPRQYLESVERQIQILAQMGEGDEDSFVRYSLEDAQRMPSLWRGMVAAWRAGDLAGLQEIALAPMQREIPQVAEDVLQRRNLEWLPQIETMLADAGVELIVVGALHLGGEGGLLELLEARGYRLEQLP